MCFLDDALLEAVEDAANDDEDVVLVVPPSDFHMEEGDAGFIAVAMAALDCCQKVVVLAD